MSVAIARLGVDVGHRPGHVGAEVKSNEGGNADVAHVDHAPAGKARERAGGQRVAGKRHDANLKDRVGNRGVEVGALAAWGGVVFLFFFGLAEGEGRG